MSGKGGGASARISIRGALGSALLAVAVIGSLVSLFVPWSQLGSTRRSGYGLAHALADAGLVTTSPERALLTALYGLPVLAGLTLAALVARRQALAGLFAGVIGIVDLTAAAAVLVSMPTSTAYGVPLGLGVGALTLLLALSSLLTKGVARVRSAR